MSPREQEIMRPFRRQVTSSETDFGLLGFSGAIALIIGFIPPHGHRGAIFVFLAFADFLNARRIQ
jgi:hypothetical protein